jgi:hypothetical protein
MTMRNITVDQLLCDRRRMMAYICSRILSEEDTDVLLADGDDGDLRVFLYPVWDERDGWDLFWETDCPEAVALLDIYMHFRRQEKTWWGSGLDLAGWVRRTANKRATRPPSCLPGETDFAADGMALQRKLITPRECQRDRFQNKISLRQIYGLFYGGEIDGFRVGRKVLLFDDSVEAYIGRNRNKSVSRDQEPEREQEPKSETPVDPIRPKERPQRRQPSGFQFFHLPEGR